MERRRLNGNKKTIAILALISLTVAIISVMYDNSNKQEQVEETPKETILETIKETKKETDKASKEIEKDINKEIEKEIKKIEDKGLSKEEQEKEIEKAKEKVIERVATKKKVDKGDIVNTVERNVSKRVESSSKINPEIRREAKETKKETVKETKKEDVITTKRITETESIPYKTIDRYANTGAKSRVEVSGRKGVKTHTIEVTYKNGVEVSRKTISSEVTSNPKDQVIARYINEPKKVEKTIEVEDKSKPIIDYTNPRDRWFVRYRDESVKYFYNEQEAYDAYRNSNGTVLNWGTAEPEYDEEIIGYETTTKTITETVDNYVWKY